MDCEKTFENVDSVHGSTGRTVLKKRGTKKVLWEIHDIPVHVNTRSSVVYEDNYEY